jgi:glycosyltransferase involved in cell wall biosynthesis
VSAWPSLADDPLVRPGASGRARVAIASYEFVGPVRNGGIGTACTSLARALAEDGHEVELVFTGWPEEEGDEAFETHRLEYSELGIALDRIDLDPLRSFDGVLYNAAHSLALYRLLRDRDRERPYDAIHFVESLGHGYYALLAKRQGLAFAGATTVVGTHSPRRWLAEAHGVPFDNLVEIGDDFLERRSVELADVVVSPSAHMLDWMTARDFDLPERAFVQQYVTRFEEPSPEAGERIRELVFFGRLEPRKGMVVLCDALDEIAAAAASPLDLRVTFLGKQVQFGDGLSGEYLRSRAEAWPWPIRILDDMDRDAALAYLREGGRLAVMPSTMDNSPNTVYEALGLGIPFLASRAGGTGELVHAEYADRLTYDPHDPDSLTVDPGDLTADRPEHTGRRLAAAIEAALGRPSAKPGRFAVPPEDNREAHLAWHRALAGTGTGTVASGELPGALDESDLVLRVDDGVDLPPDSAEILTRAAAQRGQAGFFVALGRLTQPTPDGPVERVYLPTGGPAPCGLLGNCFGAGVVLARRAALERLGWPADDGDAPAATFELLATAALAGERIEVVPEVLFEDVRGEPLTRVPDRLRQLRPYHRAVPADARDLPSVAARLAIDSAAWQAEAERARADAEAARRSLAALIRSRSFRAAAPLRRVAGVARRVRRR